MKRKSLISTIARDVTVDLGAGHCGVVLITVVDTETGKLVDGAYNISTMERDDSDGISDGMALMALSSALAMARAQKAN